VDRDGVLYVNGVENTIEKAELQLQLLSIDTPILLMIDETVEFKQFVDIVDLLKRLSLDKVSVLTRKDS